jgi:hypothetical protein
MSMQTETFRSSRNYTRKHCRRLKVPACDKYTSELQKPSLLGTVGHVLPRQLALPTAWREMLGGSERFSECVS